ISTTILLGATYSNITLGLIPQVISTGTLSLPSGLARANVTVDLSSSLLNESVGGASFELGFYATPGIYSAYATATSGGTTYASLSRVTVAADGNITP